jgi:hypothetical protein
MTSLTRFVNTVAHTSGDGTTNGTGNGGTNSFVSLSAAITALAQTLTGITCTIADEDGNLTIALDIICTGTAADTISVVINNAAWVTNATHRLRIRCDQDCGAKWDTTKYHLSTTVANLGSINIAAHPINLTLQDIQCENTTTLDNSPTGVRCNDGSAVDLHVINGFYRITGTTGVLAGIPSAMYIDENATAGSVLHMRNTTASSDGAGVVTAYLGGNDQLIYNCTFVDRDASGTSTVFIFDRGGASTGRYKNLLLQGSGVNYSQANGAPTQTATILTKDTTSPTVGLRSKTCTFVNAAAYDYHSTGGDPSVGAGTNLVADAFMPFNIDCDGNQR